MSRTRPATLALAVLIAACGLSACGEDRWCEHDATDTKVSDSYCERGVAGYEWEPDSDHKKSKKKSKKGSKPSKQRH